MRIQVCVPTYSKTDKDIINLYHLLNLSTDALFSVQKSDKDYIKEMEIDNHKVTIVYLTSTGVSKNRNSLLDNATGDIIINTDDDCPLVDNYVSIVENAFNEYKEAGFILFNGVVTHENNRLVHNKNTKRVRKFNDVSYAGGPGLVYKKEIINKYKLRYNTNVGYPNKIQAGEDSLFIKDIVSSKANFIRSKEVLFIIKDDVDNSTYFSGVSDDFVITKGYVSKLLHPHLTKLYILHYSFRLRHWRNNKKSYFELIKLMNKGSKLAKKENKG